jgi:hypothetical protein
LCAQRTLHAVIDVASIKKNAGGGRRFLFCFGFSLKLKATTNSNGAG